MAAKDKNYTTKQLLQAIKGSDGIISTIAARLKCDWNTAKKYISENEEASTALQNERECMLDEAESVIHESLRQKNVKTAKWYLATKGKERGYVETTESIVRNADPLNINIAGDPMTRGEIDAQDSVETSDGESAGQ